MVILCHGGKFCLQVYKNEELIHNRSESKYVIRGKQGGRQANADKHKSIASLGSSMRRANEKLLEEYILNHMEEAKPYIQRSAAIFLHAPGFNKNLFLS